MKNLDPLIENLNKKAFDSHFGMTNMEESFFIKFPIWKRLYKKVNILQNEK